MQIVVPFRTIVVILLTLAFIQIFDVLAPLILTVVIAGMIAIALEPGIEWLQRRGLPRALSILIVTMIFLSAVGTFVALIAPKVYAQAIELYRHLPQVKRDLLDHLQEHEGLRAFLEENLGEDLLPKSINLSVILGAGHQVLGGVAQFVLIFVLAIFLLVDGRKIYEWVRAYFSPETQDKISETNREVSKILAAYVTGQAIASTLSFIYVMVALSWIGVPNALLLATVAAVLDAVPVLGFVVSVVPAMIFAVKISFSTSLLVLGLYLLYHAIENYLVLPMVYGRRLRVAGFAVFFGILIGGLIGGVRGAIAVIPVLAAYPVIEKIWLKNIVRKETIAAHE